jgi:tRNA threonylcarbamoyladenosine biosynthesis protein TsaB
LEDNHPLGQIVFDADQRTAQSFAPSIVQQLESVGWSPQDVQLIAVTQGPGSFTGLRIGITAAKTLAYAVGAEVIGVNTLKVIASQVPAEQQDVWTVMDAQRGQLFAARFRRSDDDWETIAQTHIMDNERWLQSLTPDTAITGPGLARLRDRLPAGIVVVDDGCWTPQADSVGRVGYLEFRAGKRDDLWALVPEYFRKSAAEEKFEAKTANRQ